MQGRALLMMVAAMAFQGCSGEAANAPGVSSTTTGMPLSIRSSADLGCLPSDAAPVSRIVRICNSSDATIGVSRWSVSCDCLGVEPAKIDFQPMAVSYIRLVYDVTKEGTGFVGSLLIKVKGFAGSECVCAFDVPVSVVPLDDLGHLDAAPD